MVDSVDCIVIGAEGTIALQSRELSLNGQKVEVPEEGSSPFTEQVQEFVDCVRAGLLKTHNIPRGRLLMMLWQIDAFEAVPADYAKRLDEVLKEYPAPQR